MKSKPWSVTELVILRGCISAAVAYRALASAGFPRTMAAVKNRYRKLRLGVL